MRQRELKLEIDMYLKEIEQCIKFTTSSGIVLDLETNLGCFENTEGMSSHWNFFKLEFNEDFTKSRSFEFWDLNHKRLINEGLFDEEAIFTSQFIDHNGNLIDTETKFFWPFDYGHDNEKTPHGYIEFFKKIHGWSADKRVTVWEREIIITYKKRIEYLNNKLLLKQIKLKSIRFF
jgi:hypothetical protein